MGKENLNYEKQTEELFKKLEESPSFKVRYLLVRKFNIFGATVFAGLEEEFAKAIKEGKTVDITLDTPKTFFLLNVGNIISNTFNELSIDAVSQYIKELCDNNFIEICIYKGEQYVCFNQDIVKDLPKFPTK